MVKKAGLLLQLKAMRKTNLEENLKFVDRYVAFMRKKSNREWSNTQRIFLDDIYKSAQKNLNLKPTKERARARA